MKSETFERLKARVPEETKIYVRKYSQILDRIEFLIERNKINQKQLADALGKKPAEISKWMNSEQNLTLKTICKLEAALGDSILSVPLNIPTHYFISARSTHFAFPTETPAKVENIGTIDFVPFREAV